MRWISRFNESEQIIANTSEELENIVWDQINKLGLRADLNHIDISNVESISGLFLDSQFNGDISLWRPENIIWAMNTFMNSKFAGDTNKWVPEKLKHWGLDKLTIKNSPLENNPPYWFYYFTEFHEAFPSVEEFVKSCRYYQWIRPNRTISYHRFGLMLRDYPWVDFKFKSDWKFCR